MCTWNPDRRAVVGLVALLLLPASAAAQRGRRIQLEVGEETVLSASGVERFYAPEDGPARVETSDDGGEFVIRGVEEGTAELVLFYANGREQRYEIVVRAPPGGGAVGPVGERENIRLDLYFVELSETYSHQIGIGFPGSIGGAGVGTGNFVFDFIDQGGAANPAFSAATLQLVNQILPRLDLAQASGWLRLRRQAMLVTANGTPARINAGGEFNIVVQGALTAEIRTIEFGSLLEMTPRFDPESQRIEVRVDADLSELTEAPAGAPPGRRRTRLQSLVNLEPGQAIVLGGLDSRFESETRSGLPGLSQIPIFGVLFGTNARRGEAVQSFLFIIPTVVQAVPRAERDYIREALETFERFSGNVADVEMFERTPPGYGVEGGGAESPPADDDGAPRRSERAMALTMSIVMADGSRSELEVPDGAALSIGRDPTCHVVLPSMEVSRRHLLVERAAGGYLVTDSSANGTRIGAALVRGATVRADDGTPMQVGPYTLRLRERPEPDVPPPALGAPPPPGATLRPPAPGGRASTDDHAGSGTADVPVRVRKRIHEMLLENLDLASLDRSKMDAPAMAPKVREALRRIVAAIGRELPDGTDTAALIDEITDEALGLGPLERLLEDDDVSEIMVVDPTTIYVERKGKIVRTALRFTDDEAVRAVIERIVTPLGRRIDESTPLVDARLKDGSRVNAVIRPLAIKGSCITIRKFRREPLTVDDLIGFGSLDERMARFIRRAVQARKNIVVSGGTGSGKTTLLNVLSGFIPEDERVVTAEDAAELQLSQAHVVSLESRPANMEGRGELTIRDLVRNALRMRPDRIIVGECRGGEALDMLQAMNTGHEGSMTTTHANSPKEAVARLETLALMAGLDLPSRAIREQIAQSLDLVVQQTRFADGSRRITAVSEIVGLDEDGEVELHDIFSFHRSGTGEGGAVLGEFRASGYLPSFLDEFIALGLIEDGIYL